MIDFATENVMSLQEAAATLPRRRRGAKPHVATLFRWASSGCKGVKLETLQIGGTKCTSREALSRFFNALSNPTPATTAVQTRSAKCRERDIERAERACEASGI